MIICDRNALKYSKNNFAYSLTIFEVCFRQEIPLFQIFMVTHQSVWLHNHKKSERVVFLDENKPHNCL